MVSKAQNVHANLLGKEIKPVASAKDLGVVLDPIRTYNNHVGSTLSCCMVQLGQINRVKYVLGSFFLVFSKLYYMFGTKPPNTT